MGTLERAHADTIYRGGPILTMTGDLPMYADAVAVKDGRIAFVGPLAAAEALKGPKTNVRNLDGRPLLPGFFPGSSTRTATSCSRSTW
jgi:predicted amidohydrolase YtcJ